jgi:hypothetical protein
MDGALLKLDWAKKHLRYLKTEMETFFESKPYSIKVEPHADFGKYDIRAYVSRDIPTALSLIAGDCVHNLRSVLDHLVWELSNHNWRARPNAFPQPSKKTQFPIFENALNNKEIRSRFLSKIKSLAPSEVTVIESLQPCVVAPNNPQSHPLWLLSELDIRDKHKRINLMLGTFSGVEYVLVGATGQIVRDRVHASDFTIGPNQWLPLEHGAILVTLAPLSPSGHPVQSIVQVQASVTPEIVFGLNDAAQFKPVIPTIESLVVTVEAVVEALRPLFPLRLDASHSPPPEWWDLTEQH